MIGGPVHGGRKVLQVCPARTERLRGRGTQRGTEAIPQPDLGVPRLQLGQVVLVLLQLRERVFVDRALAGQLRVEVLATAGCSSFTMRVPCSGSRPRPRAGMGSPV